MSAVQEDKYKGPFHDPGMKGIGVFMPILLNHDWQVEMTDCAIKTMRCTTSVDFHLGIIEGGKSRDDLRYGDLSREAQEMVDLYVPAPGTQSLTDDCNELIDSMCSKWPEITHVVHTGNDVFTRPDWLKALIGPWLLYPDTGVTTLASSDLNMNQVDWITEGVYGPFMMFSATERFNPEYSSQFADTDLIMRQYNEGKRSYRNYMVVIHHFNRQTVDAENNKIDYENSLARFKRDHGGSPLLIYRVLIGGVVL